MNRRNFLQTAAALLPTWRLHGTIHEIDLSKFCDSAGDVSFKYDLSKPFTQLIGDFPYRFATDARICIRIPEVERMSDQPDESLPPASGLPWDHGERGGWKPWPTKRHLLASGATCTACNGYGRRFGMPDDFCESCGGSGEVVEPCIQPIGGAFIDTSYDRLIRAEIGDCEYRFAVPWKFKPRTVNTVVQFRFRGGEGLLSCLNHEESLRRMKR